MLDHLISTLLINALSSAAYDAGKTFIAQPTDERLQARMQDWLERFFSVHKETVFETSAFYNYVKNQDPCRKIAQYFLEINDPSESEEAFLEQMVSDCTNAITRAKSRCSIPDRRIIYELFQGVLHLCKNELWEKTTDGEKLILNGLKQSGITANLFHEEMTAQMGAFSAQLQDLLIQQGTSPPRFLTDKAPKAPTEFVARKETIEDILNRLDKKKNLVVVNGMGGIGKSALCKWLFHYFENESSFPLAWVEYDGKDLFKCFVKQFHYPGIDITERENLLSAFIQQEIPDNGIIFVDNLDVTEDDEPYIQTLTNAKCRVVCSSRITNFDFFEPVRIDLLTPDHAQLLFLSYYSPGIRYEQYSCMERDCIASIVKKLGYHTLTIEVVAKIGCVEQQTLGDIKANLDLVGFNFSGIAKVNFTEKTLIGHLCKIFSIRKLGPKHRQILGAIALYPLNQVPKKILYWLDVQNNTTIRFLIRHAWFTEDHDSFYMHPIIKEVVYRLCPLKYESCRSLIEAISRKTTYQNRIPILKIMEWIPYAEQIVKHFCCIHTLQIACLQCNIAIAYSVTGNYTQGLRYITPAIKTLENLGNADDQLALAYNQKGYIYYSRKNYSDKRAYTFYQKSLSLQRVKNRTRAETYESLALCLQGMYESGLKNGVEQHILDDYLKQAEDYHIHANQFFLEPGNELHLASSYNNTGDYYRLTGKMFLAIRYYNRARKIREAQKEAAILDLSITYYRLGELYFEISTKSDNLPWKKEKRIRRALDYYERCYRIRVEQISKGNRARDADSVKKRIEQCEAILQDIYPI